MKFYILTILAALMLGCSNNFDTSAEWKEIAVIYGLLDQNDASQYIIVQRAYLSQDGNNLIGLTEPDSIFFTDHLEVTLTQSQNNQEIETTSLQMVNGNNIGFVRDEGVFPQDPNWLYQYNKPIDFLSDYKLTVRNTTSGNEYTANTKIIQDFEIIDQLGTSGINFIDNLPNTIRWFNADNAAVYQFKISIHYSERDTSLSFPVVEDKKVDRIFSRQIQPSSQGGIQSFSFDDEKLYSILSSSVEVNPKMERCFKFMDIVVSAGSIDLFRMIQAQQAQSGITEVQIQPNYSNIEGDEALGIFASRTQAVIDSIPISPGSIQAIQMRPSTAPLNFLSVSCN